MFPTTSCDRGNIGTTSEPVSVSFTVLDCAIGFEPFTVPVYQCVKGHISCSSCRDNLQNNCPSCFLPIDYIRNYGLEKVLEALKITCSNSKYGCEEKVRYSLKREHEQSCAYEPCYCPLAGCGFDGSYKDLYLHFACEHPASATRFTFGSFFSVHMGANMYKFLQEDDHTLFILNYNVQSFQNVANILCVGPRCFQNKYSYELEAGSIHTSLKLNSLAPSLPKWNVGLPEKSGLEDRTFNMNSSCDHKIQVCIRRKGEE